MTDQIDRVIVRRNTDGEWQCKAFSGIRRCEEADYFCDDPIDAYLTAKAMLDRPGTRVVLKETGKASFCHPRTYVAETVDPARIIATKRHTN